MPGGALAAGVGGDGLEKRLLVPAHHPQGRHADEWDGTAAVPAEVGGPEERCRKPAYNMYRALFLKTLVRVGRGKITMEPARSCWGLHSGRIGGASYAARCGVPGWIRRRMGGWSERSLSVSDHYVQQLEEMSAVSRKMGL